MTTPQLQGAPLLVVGAGIMGAVTLEEFSIALLVGLVVGAYSSIGVAAPVLVWLKEREPKNRTIRERLASQGVDVAHKAPKADRPSGQALLASEDEYRGEPDPGALDPDDDAGTTGSSSPDATPPRPAPTRTTPPAPSSTVIPPRPRKKGRKR